MSGEMTVNDYQKAGRLFIKLAEDKDVDGGLKPPTEEADKVTFLENAGVTVKGYTKINFIYDSEDELNLVVRRADLIKQTQEFLNNFSNSEYPFPSQMAELYRKFLCPQGGIPRPENEEMFEHRIGDYSLGNCK